MDEVYIDLYSNYNHVEAPLNIFRNNLNLVIIFFKLFGTECGGESCNF